MEFLVYSSKNLKITNRNIVIGKTTIIDISECNNSCFHAFTPLGDDVVIHGTSSDKLFVDNHMIETVSGVIKYTFDSLSNEIMYVKRSNSRDYFELTSIHLYRINKRDDPTVLNDRIVYYEYDKSTCFMNIKTMNFQQMCISDGNIIHIGIAGEDSAYIFNHTFNHEIIYCFGFENFVYVKLSTSEIFQIICNNLGITSIIKLPFIDIKPLDGKLLCTTDPREPIQVLDISNGNVVMLPNKRVSKVFYDHIQFFDGSVIDSDGRKVKITTAVPIEEFPRKILNWKTRDVRFRW